jgi:hypothetical protein
MDKIEALQAAARQCLSQMRKAGSSDECRSLLKQMAECQEQADELERQSTTDARFWKNVRALIESGQLRTL